ncbi:UNVERIFIED_CONTAM: hypothetical protein FKN15_038217 [Acipenser sinensis]
MTMAGVFIVLTALLHWIPNPSEGISIEQSPPVGERPGQSAELECRHDDSSYNYMYWYQQSRGEGAFKLIGYLQFTASSLEEKFKERFNLLANQLVLQSQKAISAPVWNSTVLQCSVKGAAMSSYTMLWYKQQQSGKAIEFICDEFANYGQGFADRFKMTHSSSENQFTLQIRNLTIEDTGTYHCAARHCEAALQAACTKRYRQLVLNKKERSRGLKVYGVTSW